ncbi:MAG TPA: hypothetical protein VIB49_06895 [Thermoplasmata archaeon]|jgi:hypothetical protein
MAGLFGTMEWASVGVTGMHLPDLLSAGLLPSRGIPIAFGLVLLAVPLFLGLLLLSAIIEGGLVCHATWLHRGRRSTVGWALGVGLRRTLETIAASLLMALGLGLLSILFIAPLILATALANTAFLGFYYVGLLAWVLVTVYLLTATVLYVPAIVVGTCRSMESLSRSIALTRGHRLSLLAVFLAVGLVGVPFLLPLLWPGGSPDVVALQLGLAIFGASLSGSLGIVARGVSFDLLLTPWKGA